MIYLDSAATSMLKPDSVSYAVIEAMSNMGSPGRGAHEAAMRAADTCFDCRENLARLFHVPKPENVVFTFNATHGLNIAIDSLIKRRARVLTTGYEHNSVVRPLRALDARLDVIRTPLFDRRALLKEFRARIPQADAAVFTHVSNVFGYILPVEEMAALCRQYRKPFIIDASQSAGVLELDFEKLGADFVAMPGHKGLMGPQGTGVLLCKNEASPLLYGGSGSNSRLPLMPDFLPDRLEAGTHNVAGIAGLNAGVKYILARGCGSLFAHERRLLDGMAESLGDCGQLRLYYSPRPECQSGVLSLVPEGAGCDWLGDRLSEQGIAVRTGLQCAPFAHETVGTLDTGTVRFSFSPFNSREEAARTVDILKKIIKNS